MENAATKPVQIDLDRTRELRIEWADGQRSVLPLALLRKACPCALCRSQRAEAQTSLPVLPSSNAQVQMVVAQKAELVGQYALAITWQDGHSGGIYDYVLLRSLDPAETPTDSRSAGDQPRTRTRPEP